LRCQYQEDFSPSTDTLYRPAGSTRVTRIITSASYDSLRTQNSTARKLPPSHPDALFTGKQAISGTLEQLWGSATIGGQTKKQILERRDRERERERAKERERERETEKERARERERERERWMYSQTEPVKRFGLMAALHD
jgi:hypothetical protein